MQVLKDEIRKLILDTAEVLFLEHGFIDTTTRMIARQVGISVSNLYLYYENKEALYYAITDSYFQDFTQGVSFFLDHKNETDDTGKRLNQILYDMIVLNRCKFLLILEKSKGTKYENFKITLIEELKKHIQYQMNSKVHNKDLLALVFANGLIEGIIIIAKEYQNAEQLYNNIECITEYHLEGIKNFLK